jgi:hypothetical protein
MTIFGKRLSEYVAFSNLFLGLILIVGIARLALSLSGVPNSTAKWLSITAVMWISLGHLSIYTSGFELQRASPNLRASDVCSTGGHRSGNCPGNPHRPRQHLQRTRIQFRTGR